MISKCYPKSKFKTKHSFRIYSSGQLKWLKIEWVNPSWRINKYLLYFFAKNDSPVSSIWLNTTSMVYIYFPLYMQLSESLSIFLHCSIKYFFSCPDMFDLYCTFLGDFISQLQFLLFFVMKSFQQNIFTIQCLHSV